MKLQDIKSLIENMDIEAVYEIQHFCEKITTEFEES